MQINCPRCKKPQEMEEAMLGEKWQCAECGQKIRVSQPKIKAVEPPEPEKEQVPEPPEKEEVSKEEAPLEKKPKRVSRPSAQAVKERETAGSARFSRRKAALIVEEELEEKGASRGKKSNDQLVYMAVGFVVVFILFGLFVLTSGKKKKNNKRQHKEIAQLAPLEIMRSKVKKDSENRELRKDFAKMLMEDRQYIEAYRNLMMLMDKKNIKIYTLSIECAFKLGKRDEALKDAERAEKFAPDQMEAIDILIADDIRNRGQESLQAKEVGGMKKALEDLKMGRKHNLEGPDNNDEFKVASAYLEKALEVLYKAQGQFPYNKWIENRIVFANRELMWAHKMYRDLSDKDKKMWEDDDK